MVADALPAYSTKVEIFTEGFVDILVGDYITLKFTLVRKNLEPNREIGVAHSKDFPGMFQEKVAVLVTQNQKIIYEAIMEVDKKEIVKEFKHRPTDVFIF